MEPPKVPAQYRAAIMAMAGTGSREMVKGSSSATAMGELSPGSAPTRIPTNTPMKMSRMLKGSSSSDRPRMTASMVCSYRTPHPIAPGSK